MNIRRILGLSNHFEYEEEIILRDYLALERTKLANERTLLSYIRSSLYLLVGGIAVIQLEGFENIKFIGYVAIVLTMLLIVIGVYRFYRLNKHLRRFYRQIELLKVPEKKEHEKVPLN